MLYGNKLGNLRVSGCFISTTALSTMILLSARSLVRTRLSGRAGHDCTYVAFKKLLSAKGKGDSMAPNIKSDEQLSDDRTYRGSRRTDNTRRWRRRQTLANDVLFTETSYFNFANDCR
jgi:hypothetical protein